MRNLVRCIGCRQEGRDSGTAKHSDMSLTEHSTLLSYHVQAAGEAKAGSPGRAYLGSAELLLAHIPCRCKKPFFFIGLREAGPGNS